MSEELESLIAAIKTGTTAEVAAQAQKADRTDINSQPFKWFYLSKTDSREFLLL